MISLTDILLIFFITLLSAIPPVLVSVYLSLRWLMRNQLENLPALLRQPAVQVAMKEAIAELSRLGSGDFTKAIGEPIGREVGGALEAAINEQVVPQLKTIISGAIGGHMKNIKGQIAPGGNLGSLREMTEQFDRFKAMGASGVGKDSNPFSQLFGYQ